VSVGTMLEGMRRWVQMVCKMLVGNVTNGFGGSAEKGDLSSSLGGPMGGKATNAVHQRGS